MHTGDQSWGVANKEQVNIALPSSEIHKLHDFSTYRSSLEGFVLLKRLEMVMEMPPSYEDPHTLMCIHHHTARKQ